MAASTLFVEFGVLGVYRHITGAADQSDHSITFKGCFNAFASAGTSCQVENRKQSRPSGFNLARLQTYAVASGPYCFCFQCMKAIP